MRLDRTDFEMKTKETEEKLHQDSFVTQNFRKQDNKVSDKNCE